MNQDETQLTEQETQTLIQRCPNCGAQPKYDINTGQLACEHCGHRQEIEVDDSVQRRQLTDEIRKTRTNWTDGKVFKCDGCGAKEVLAQKDITRRCAFCGNKNIISTDELSGVKPDSVIPFKVDINRARELFRRWINSKWLAPRMFKTYDIRECMSAVYCPAWSFTTNAQSMYNGTFGRREHFQTRNHQGQIITQSRTFHFHARGNMNINYIDHLVQSSDRISPALFNQLKPFALREIKPYRTEFLAGIITEHYTRELDQCFNEFSTFIRQDMRRRIMQKHGADMVQRLDLNLQFPSKEFNYILLPLYIATYKYRGRQFNFFINGSSGKIVGRYPKSKFKIFALCLGLGLLVAGAIGLGLYLHIHM